MLLTVIAVLLGAGAAAASTSAPVPQLVFPILGAATYTDDFGDPRGQGAHEGNDMLAPRRALALAAEAGTVKFHTTSSRAGCMLYLEGKSGTSTSTSTSTTTSPTRTTTRARASRASPTRRG